MNSPVQTGVKSAGWEKNTSQRPRNPESLIGPRVERASKSGATSPIRSVRMRSIESRLEIKKNLTSCAARQKASDRLHTYIIIPGVGKDHCGRRCWFSQCCEV